MLPKELHQLKYDAISASQGSVCLVKKTQERKSSTCYLLITKERNKGSRTGHEFEPSTTIDPSCRVKTGKQLPKVVMPEDDFWRRSEPVIEEEIHMIHVSIFI
ncbi:hypothetical protein TNCV_1007401 [Trichonephila clavipes]|nr:hypothetical protein TNCV_1007401 [Trichonephila clavipes]